MATGQKMATLYPRTHTLIYIAVTYIYLSIFQNAIQTGIQICYQRQIMFSHEARKTAAANMSVYLHISSTHY